MTDKKRNDKLICLNSLQENQNTCHTKTTYMYLWRKKDPALAEKNLCQKTWDVPTELWMSNIKPVGLFPNAE